MKYLLALLIPVALLCSAWEINQWERANGYPFGRFCELTSQCGGR